MKRIFLVLMLMPLSSFAMEKKDERIVAISLTRDGEGERKVVSLSPDGQEIKTKFPMFSRDLKSKYEYTVALSLLNLKNKHATIKSYLSKEQLLTEKESAAIFTETIKIDEKALPVNQRNVMEFKYLSDMTVLKDDKTEVYPVTLGLVILDFPALPNPKL